MRMTKRIAEWAFLLLGIGLIQVFSDSSLATTEAEPGPVQRLQQALRIKTVSYENSPIDSQAFYDFQRFIRESFPRIADHLQIETWNGLSLLLTWKGSDQTLEPLLVLAHFDVVPAIESDWTHPPFGGDIDGGFLWGRGALDNKGNALGALEAVDALLVQGMRPRRTVQIFLGHDEELGGTNGARALAQQWTQEGRRLYAVLDEGSYIMRNVVPGVGSRPVAMIGIAEKGYMTVRFTLKGEPGHSSIPSSKSIIVELAQITEKFQKSPLPPDLKGVPSAFFESIANHADFPYNFMFKYQGLFAPALRFKLSLEPASNAFISTTSALTLFQAGIKENVLPSEASFTVNFRVHPNNTLQELESYIGQMLAGSNVQYTIDPRALSPPSPVSSVTSEVYQTLSRCAQRTFPDALVAPSLVVVMTDSRHFTGLTDQIFRFSAFEMDKDKKDLNEIHGNNERISLEAYSKLIEFDVRALRGLAL